MPNAPITEKNTEDSPPNGKNPRCFLFSGSAIFPWGLFPRRRTAPHSSVLFSIPAFHPVPYGRLDIGRISHFDCMAQIVGDLESLGHKLLDNVRVQPCCTQAHINFGGFQLSGLRLSQRIHVDSKLWVCFGGELRHP